MNWPDIFIVTVVGASMVIGILRGFVRECFSLASYGIGYLIATGTYAVFASRLEGIIDNPRFRSIICFAAIFILAVVLVHQIGRLLRKLISKTKGLSLMDRLLGMFFGFCRGGLILALVMIPLSLFPHLGGFASIKDSTLSPYLIAVSRELSTRAFSQNNIVGAAKSKIPVRSLKVTFSGGFHTLRKAAGSLGSKLTETIGNGYLSSLGRETQDKEGIRQKDREKLDKLLNQL